MSFGYLWDPMPALPLMTLSMSFLFPEFQSSHLSYGITIPILQMNLKHPAECQETVRVKEQHCGLYVCNPPSNPSLQSVFLPPCNAWQELEPVGLLTRAQGNCTS